MIIYKPEQFYFTDIVINSNEQVLLNVFFVANFQRSNETRKLQPVFIHGQFKTSETLARTFVSDFKRSSSWRMCKARNINLGPGDLFSGKVIFERKDSKNQSYVTDSFKIKINPAFEFTRTKPVC